jgi:hypothetical protein
LKHTPLPFRSFTVLDAVLVLALTAAAVAFIPFMRSLAPSTVVVFVDNVKFAEYPLDEPRIFSVPGRQGEVVVEVAERAARVYRATCPNQICVRTGRIRQPGQQIICVPNHVLIEIRSVRGSGSPEVDGVVK